MNPTPNTRHRGGILCRLTGRRRMVAAAAGLTLLLASESMALSLGPASAAFAATGINGEDRADNLLGATGLSSASASSPALLTGTPEESDAPAEPLPMPADLPKATTTPIDLTTAGGDPVTVDLGGMEVGVAAPDDGDAPDEVLVGVADPATAKSAGVTAGVLLTVTDTPEAPADPGQSVELTVSYKDFAGLAGGDWESRLQAVWIPDCDTTNTTTGCLSVPINSSIDPDARTVTVEVPVTPTADPAPAPAPTPTDEPTPQEEPAPTETPIPSETPTEAPSPAPSEEPAPSETPAPAEPGDALAPSETPQAQARLGVTNNATLAADTGTASGSGSVALTAGVAGPQGDWSATSLAPSSTWAVSGSTGSFTWSYPMRVPKAAAGPSPELSIGYSSGAVDGRVPSTNNQAGPVGEGFDLGASFIERAYVPCSEDETGSANNIGKSAPDLCWGKDNATLSLAGAGTELVKDADGVWRPRKDDGTRIEQLASGGAAGEYWKVTTTDGTQYLFGSSSTAKSAWQVPVFGNHPGEKCHAAAFTSSQCSQVWRWNLDRVIDPSGNTASYFYTPETNRYRPFYGTGTLAYTAGGRLDRIEYGTRTDSTVVPAKVEFQNLPRCITDLGKPDSWCLSTQTGTSSNHWLDTPTDLICNIGGPCTTYTPTFFDRTRLARVQTYADSGAGWEPVDSWTLSQRFSPQGTGISLHTAKGVMLQLAQIKHDANGGDALTDLTSIPAVKFDYTDLANRVGKKGEAYDALYRPRVHSIRTEAGGRITVAYQTGCQDGIPSDAATNTALCFPVKWRGSGDGMHWFHKWVVKTITEGHTQIEPGTPELSTGSLAKITNYSYGAPVWAKPVNPIIPDKERTWSEFRGTKTVTTTLGETGSTDTKTRTAYYTGTGKTLTAGPGGEVTTVDDDRFTGQPFQSVTYNGNLPVSETVTELTSKTTGASTLDASYTADRVATQTSHQYTYKADGAEALHAETRTHYNTYGQPVTVDDFGRVGDTGDNTCTTTTYAHDTNTTLKNAHLVALPATTETTSKTCDQAGDLVRPKDVVTAARTTYDTAGRPIKIEPIDPVDGTGYAPATTYTYDAVGRITAVTDPAGQKTTTAYTPAGAGLPASQTVTNPAGHTTTTHLNPILGVPTKTVDANGRATTAIYDAAARILTVRYPQHATTKVPSVAYEYTVKPNGLNAVVTKTIGADGVTQHASAVLYDALMRPFQTQQDAPTAAGGRAVTTTIYDAAGRVTEQTNPWWATGTASATPIMKPADTSGTTTYTYDQAGRQTASIFWIGTPSNAGNEKSRTQTRYDGPTTLTVPPIGGVPTATTVDARGRTITLTHYHRDPETQKDKDTPDEVLTLPSQATTYAYTPAGQLESMTDPGPKLDSPATDRNTWSYGYDWAGRQTKATDPDAGVTTTTYDVLGRVTTRTNGNKDTLGYTYDALGRQTSLRSLPTGSTDPADPAAVERATWTYDTTLKGVLASATRKISPTEQYTTRTDAWDVAYRPTQTSVILPNTGAFSYLGTRTLTTKHTYTGDGQTNTTTYPAVTRTLPTGTPPTVSTILPEETVTTMFDQASSQPSWMSGGFGWGVYVASSGTDYQGRTTFMDLGNTYGNVVSYRYENGTGRLQNIRLDRERIAGTELDVTYTYDPAGNVTSVKDRPTNAGLATDTLRDQQCFNYDQLARLDQAWTPKTGDCNGIPATTNMGGAAPYWNVYEHDLLGNRTKLTTRTTAGATTTVTNTYGQGDAGPHQLTSLTTGGVATALTYDDAGNRTQKTTGTATSSYDWDVESELTSTGTTNNVYDADGNRLTRTDPTGTTIYAGGQEILITPTGDVKATRYYTYAGKTIAVRTNRGLGTVSSLVTDHHGTPLAATPTGNPAATPIKRLYTDPYGATRSPSTATTMPGDIQFLGKNRDTGTGLTLLDARYYDETTGTFISVDPILDLTDPQQWNGYAYSGNNPATYSDATGLLMLGTHDSSTYNPHTRKETKRTNTSSSSNEIVGSISPPLLVPSISPPVDDSHLRKPTSGPKFDESLNSAARDAAEAGFWSILAGLGLRSTAARGATAAAATKSSIQADLLTLTPGRTTGYTVFSESQLKDLFLRWTRGSTKDRVLTTEKYQIDMYKLPDGTVVQWRSGSSSGGATVEIRIPGMKKPEKIHIDG